MPWCPKCKNEYREGITVCADCNTSLVDEIAEEEKVGATTPDFREPAKIYTKQKDKYKDLNSTAYTFLIVGILGLAFVAANALGISSFIKNAISGVLYTAIFAGCIFVAFISFKDAKKAKSQIQGEEDLTAKVNKWLEENISEKTFAEVVDEELSDEANYLNKLEHMTKLLTKQFPELDADYADQLCEEFYGEKFE